MCAIVCVRGSHLSLGRFRSSSHLSIFETRHFLLCLSICLYMPSSASCSPTNNGTVDSAPEAETRDVTSKSQSLTDEDQSLTVSTFLSLILLSSNCGGEGGRGEAERAGTAACVVVVAVSGGGSPA